MRRGGQVGTALAPDVRVAAEPPEPDVAQSEGTRGKGFRADESACAHEEPAKREFSEAFFDRLRDFPLTTFAVVTDRPTRTPYDGTDSLQTHHRYLLERVNLFMERDFPDDLALLVYDNLDPGTAANFAASLDAFMERGGGKSLTHIVPSALFSDSEFTPGVQVADRFAYAVRINEEEKLHQQSVISDPYLSTIKRYASIIRTKTRNYELPEVAEGFVSYGISTIGADKLLYEPPADRAERRKGGG